MTSKEFLVYTLLFWTAFLLATFSFFDGVTEGRWPLRGVFLLLAAWFVFILIGIATSPKTMLILIYTLLGWFYLDAAFTKQRETKIKATQAVTVPAGRSMEAK